jgi:hypothetical protein
MGFSFFVKRRKKRLFSATRRTSRRADRYPYGPLSRSKRARPDRWHRLTLQTRSSCPLPNKKNTQSEGGAFEAYAAAEEEELDVGDVERDRFRYDHVPASMMLPKELMGDTPVEAVIEKPKRRTSARKKAGTKL